MSSPLAPHSSPLPTPHSPLIPLLLAAAATVAAAGIAAWLLGPVAAAAVLGAEGMWLLLPRGDKHGRRFGAVVGAAGLALLGAQVLRLHDPWHDGVFLFLAITTVVSAVGAVTMRSPVYCAIWFALTLLSTGGLFLVQGAQFLGLATVAVYAGAILVTFLFVLMLAQPEGHASYDRVSWEGFVSSCAGAILVGLLTAAVFVPADPPARSPTSRSAVVVATHVPPDDVLHPDHMARLGGQLFSKHLIAVEIAGTLLLIALVGAIAIAGKTRAA